MRRTAFNYSNTKNNVYNLSISNKQSSDAIKEVPQSYRNKAKPINSKRRLYSKKHSVKSRVSNSNKLKSTKYFGNPSSTFQGQMATAYDKYIEMNSNVTLGTKIAPVYVSNMNKSVMGQPYEIIKREILGRDSSHRSSKLGNHQQLNSQPFPTVIHQNMYCKVQRATGVVYENNFKNGIFKCLQISNQKLNQPLIIKHLETKVNTQNIRGQPY